MTGKSVQLLNRLWRHDDERGAAMAEYGLLLAFIALVVMAVLIVIGDTIAETFGFAADTFADAEARNAGGTTTTP